MRLLYTAIPAIFVAVILTAVPARAIFPPPPGMIEQMREDGTLEAAKEFAKELGTYDSKVPRRGALNTGDYTPQQLADLIAQNLGRSLDDGRSASSIGKSTSRELAWVELDLNYDRMVDERDLLALGQPRPKVAATLPSLGTNEMFCLLIEFPDYPHYYPASDFDNLMFGSGNPSTWYRGLHYFYDKSSYGQQNITGDIHGWYTAINERAYYHPNDNNSYPWDTTRRHELMYEAIAAADAAGTDFSDYDNDGDGVIDEFVVVWTGPHGNWATFWWGYHTSWGDSPTVDGVTFGSYSWQWERSYGFSAAPPTGGSWDPIVVIHETGHAQGLPDYYDYDGDQGPDGGVGGLDMMDAAWGDHNCYSKFILGWLNPTVAFTNLDDEVLEKSNAVADAVIIMPGFDPVSPWSEYFMAQYRSKDDVDSSIPASGMLLWHVDSRVKHNGGFLWNNSYTEHKRLRLMEADGLEEIETDEANADADDFYMTGASLSPASSPNSNDYEGNSTNITIDDFSAAGTTMTADFTLYSNNPPTVTVDAPIAGTTVSGDVIVTVSAADDSAVDHVQLIIDGILVKQWDTWTSPQNYTWNTRVEFNSTNCEVLARAWDDGDQASSHSITVSVSNPGVGTFSEDFEAGLDNWRIQNPPGQNRGQYTVWSTRTSPSSPTPLGSGREAYVDPLGGNSTWHAAHDLLRSQRIDASAYSNDLHLTFHYRCRDGFGLYATTDEGATWLELAQLPVTNSWKTFNQSFDMDGSTVYFELRYLGTLRQNTGSAQGANIDDFYVREAVSLPPTVTITSHSTGDTVTGNTTFTATAADDGSIDRVMFYLDGSLKHTEYEAPYTYSRDTAQDDSHPGIELSVISVDDDEIFSTPDAVTLVWFNQRNFPAADDLEADADDWSFENDSDTPNWAWGTDEAHSGTHSMGWFDSNTFDQGNSDGLFYHGYEPIAGLHSIDLANADVSDPVVRFWYKGDVPSSASSTIYLYNSWDGYLPVANWLSDAADWTQLEFSLAQYKGYSGKICFWVWSGNNTTGTGLWIDDIEVTNNTPGIVSITPDRGVAGETITILGCSFGDSEGTSTIEFGGAVTAQSSDIVSWSNTQIQVQIPAGAISGNVTVTINGVESNGEYLTVVLPPPVIGGIDQI